MIERPPAPRVEKPQTEIQLERLDRPRSEKILAQTKIHGEPFKGHELTTEILAKHNLEPQVGMDIKGGAIYFSFPYKFEEKAHTAIVAYVKKRRDTDDPIVARTYYTSRSQTLWRYLPDYTISEKDELGWYGKGYYGMSESSLNAPFAAQEALAMMEAIREPKIIKGGDQIFAGTAKQVDYDAMFARQKQVLPVSYYRSMPPLGQAFSGQFHAQPLKNEKKAPPERLVFQDNKLWPDFSGPPQNRWLRDTKLYGRVYMEVFPSRDARLRYLMCRTADGRAWIGGIEASEADITSTGLIRQWVEPGDLTTPAAEYYSQAGKYAGRHLEEEGGHYVDMFEKYLSKSTYIRQYLLSKDIVEKPKKVPERITTNYAEFLEKEVPKMISIETLLTGLEVFKATELKDGRKLGQVDLRALIGLIRRGKASMNSIPEDFGLRQRVGELLAQEKGK
jgi:hypothetical protein